MFRSWTLAAIVAGGVVVVALSVAFPRLRDATPASAVVQSPFELYLDCAPGGTIDDVCALPSGTASFDIDVVAKNNSGAAISLSALSFTVVDDNKQNFVPTAPSCTAPALDCNPDFNQAGIPGDFDCGLSLPSPDLNRDGLVNTAESSIFCNTDTPAAPFIPDGGSVVLGTVHYTSIDGYATFMLTDASLFNDVIEELMSCNPVLTTGGNCFGAVVQIGGVGTNTATNTATATATPTSTVTPTPIPLTPSVTPTGAVTDVLAINEGTCVVGAVFAGLHPTLSAMSCFRITSQFTMQNLVHCLRGFDYNDDGRLDCLIPNPYIPPEDPWYPLRSDVILTPVPADFAPLDRDADQMHYGITMEIIAFVEGDYPVLFETDRGVIGTGLIGETSSYLCYTLFQDPDCDAVAPVDGNYSTSSDHVVAAKLWLTEDTRGPLRVTVTQNGQSVVKTINVVGPPETISVEAIDGKDTIETGATAPTLHGDAPLDTACDFPGEQQALAGIASPKKTVLLTKALDSDGAEVVGSLVQWDHPFAPGPFNPPAAPQGGVVFPLLPMFDLGAAGIGYPQVVCGGSSPGDLVSTLSFNGALDVPADPGYSRTFTVHVVDSLPTVTATPTPTPLSTETATPVGVATDTATALPAATDTPTPVPTATDTATPTSAATNTPTATHMATRTPTAVAGTATVVGTASPRATGTVVATRTIAATRTVEATGTALAATTVVSTTTAVGTPAVAVTASATNTAVPTATNTPVATATSSPAATAAGSSTPNATGTAHAAATATTLAASSGTPNATTTAAAGNLTRTAAAATQTVASGIRTPAGGGTVAAEGASPTRQSSVLGSQSTPRGAGVVLPATGDGASGHGFAWGIGMLAIAGAGILAGMLAFTARRRR